VQEELERKLAEEQAERDRIAEEKRKAEEEKRKKEELERLGQEMVRFALSSCILNTSLTSCFELLARGNFKNESDGVECTPSSS